MHVHVHVLMTYVVPYIYTFMQMPVRHMMTATPDSSSKTDNPKTAGVQDGPVFRFRVGSLNP